MKTSRVPISPAPSADGFKTEEAWLAEALGAKWTWRHGYTVASARRAAQFEILRAARVTASRRYFARDFRPYVFEHPAHPGRSFRLSEVLRVCQA
jgi:hypothetical protein